MNNLTLKSALFFLLFAIAFTSCKEDEEEEIPVITVSGANPLILDTINTVFVEPGVSTDKGTLITDYTSLYTNKRGEYTLYYSAAEGDNFGYATRTVIVRNPADVMEGTYSVEVINTTSGATEDYYVDQISIDSYINGKFYFSNFDAPCEVDQVLIGKFDWFNNNLTIEEQTYNGQQVLNNTGSNYGVNFNGSEVNFEMVVSISGNTRKYIYRKRNDLPQTARVMTANIITDVVTADVYYNNVNAATSLSATNSPYVTVDAVNTNAEITMGGSCVFVTSGFLDFEADKSYSVFLVGTTPSPGIIKLEDDLSDPPANQSRVRFFNGNASTNDVKVEFRDPDTFSFISDIANVNFTQNKTSQINSGNYKINVVSGIDTLYTIPTFNFAANRVYTIYTLDEGGNTTAKIATNK